MVLGLMGTSQLLTLTSEGNRLQGSVVLQQSSFLLLWHRAKRDTKNSCHPETPHTVVKQGYVYSRLWPRGQVWAVPWQGHAGEGMNKKQTGTAIPALSPNPRPTLPSHLLLDLGTVGQGVFTAVVDSHIAGWEGGVERVKGGLGGTGGDTPTCKHPTS